METIKCPICYSSDYSHYISVKDRFNIDKNIEFDLVKCKCDFIFLNPRPSELEISKYYKSNNYSPHSKNGILYRIAQKISFFWKYHLIKKYKNKCTILDYGSGKGDFSFYMNKKGFKVDNYEPILKSKNVTKDNYDIVSMWHSLEHIHDLKKTFSKISAFLKDDGFLIVAVPNIDAIERKYFKEKWCAYDAPRHLYHFNEKSISQLLDKYNFKIIKSMNIVQDTFYNIYLSLGKKRFLYFIYLSFFSLIKILLNSKKSSSKLYICTKK